MKKVLYIFTTILSLGLLFLIPNKLLAEEIELEQVSVMKHYVDEHVSLSNTLPLNKALYFDKFTDGDGDLRIKLYDPTGDFYLEDEFDDPNYFVLYLAEGHKFEIYLSSFNFLTLRQQEEREHNGQYEIFPYSIFYDSFYKELIINDMDYETDLISLSGTYDDFYFMLVEDIDIPDPNNPIEWDVYYQTNTSNFVPLNMLDYGVIITDDLLDSLEAFYINFPNDNLEHLIYGNDLLELQISHVVPGKIIVVYDDLDIFWIDLLTKEIDYGFSEFDIIAFKFKENMKQNWNIIYLTSADSNDHIPIDLDDYGLTLTYDFMLDFEDVLEGLYVEFLYDDIIVGIGDKFEAYSYSFDYDSIKNRFTLFETNLDLDILNFNLNDNTITGGFSDYNLLIIGFKEGMLRPAFDGNEHFVTNVDDPDDLSYFLSYIKAIDDFDGDISDQIVVEEDNYTTNKYTLGQYSVTLSATDSSDNTSTFTFYVHVVDITPPTVVVPEEPIEISYDKTLNLTLLHDILNMSDNYHAKSDLDYYVFQENYTANKTVMGLYTAKLVVFDPSENEVTVTIQIKVIDEVPPVINGVTEIVKSDTRIMTTVEILSGITAYDEIDGDVTDSIQIISDTYTGNAHIPNKNNTWYEIKIQAEDLSGNKSTKIIKIRVVDDTSPDWYITNGVTINLSGNAQLTRSQILNLLVKAGKVSISNNSRVTYTTDTYSGHEGEEGVYVLSFNIQEPNGNESDYMFGVNVMSYEEDDSDYDEYEDNSLATRFKEFVERNKTLIIVVTFVIAGVILMYVFLPRKRYRR